MTKKIIIFVSLFVFSSYVLAYSSCSAAAPINSSSFCASFTNAATCHCMSSGLPQGMCTNINALYQRMLSTFGSLTKACSYQKETTVQNCIDSWNCYRLGGQTSNNLLCSGTAKSCG